MPKVKHGGVENAESFNLRLPVSTLRRLKALARSNGGRTVASLIREAIDAYLTVSDSKERHDG